jgi:hypothetical protein
MRFFLFVLLIALALFNMAAAGKHAEADGEAVIKVRGAFLCLFFPRQSE